MIPVKDENIELIDLNAVTKTRSEEKYLKLLKEQIYWLNRNDEKLYYRTEKLYNNYVNNLLSDNIKDRCCNFKLLEEKCMEYNIEKVKETI